MTPQHLRITLINEKLSVGGQRLYRFAQAWLTAGLMNLGAGAKTSAGYGYFVFPPQPRASVVQAQPAQAAAEPLPESLTWRTGIVKWYRPDRHMGRLVDEQTREELSFQQAAIEKKDWSPASKQEVQYAYVEEAGKRRVVKVRSLTSF